MEAETIAKMTDWAEWALLAIVLLPLGGALANGLGSLSKEKPNRGLVKLIAVGTVGMSFLLSVFAFVALYYRRDAMGDEATIVAELYEWFSLSFASHDVPVRLAFALDGLSGIMLLFVTGIGFLIHIYSLEYMEDDEGLPRFLTYLNLFMASMLILVLGSSIPVAFVGWEGVGLCSYLLIGFWFKTPEYAAAGKKAFIMNRIGDFGVLIGMFVLFSATQSFEFAEIADRTASLTSPFYFGRIELGMTATVAGLLIFLGCTGKSAQIPLFTWLPDAMAGPTPVSALIHAATMVTAGVYLCCRMSDVLILSHVTMATIAVVGALTALLAASIALVQNNMKRILAYSTVSQLGFMFAAVGSGAFAAGIYHVFTHAFFKACLFLGAGAVMHAVHAHGDADIRKLGGLKSRLPTIHWTFAVSCLAIAGFPFLSGWFSKDEILLGSLSSMSYFEQGLGETGGMISWFVFVVLVVAATMTAFYMFRMYFLVFWGDYRSASRALPEVTGGELAEAEESEAPAHADAQHDEHGYDPHPHRPGLRIRIPLMVLGTGAIFAGWVSLEPITHLWHGAPGFWGPWLEPSVAGADGALEGFLGFLPMLGGLAACFVGIGLAGWMYVQQRRMPAAESRGLHRVLMNKWYVDELYDRTVVRPVRFLAVFSAAADKYVVDGLLAQATARGVQITGWLLTRLQTGTVSAYGAAMVVGVVGLGWWFIYPHPRLEGTVDGDRITWSAGRGLGYEYRWDQNGDGEFEHDWSADTHSLTAPYTAADWVGFALVMEGTRFDGDDELTFDADGEMPEFDLGPDWQADAEGESTPPNFRVEEDRVLVVPNDARVRVRGVPADEETEIWPGDVVQVGVTTLRVAAVVRTTVEIKSAFGKVEPQTRDMVIVPRAERRQAALSTGGSR